MILGDIAATKDRWHGDAGRRPLPEVLADCCWLSGLCDGAHARDGRGWSRFDRDQGERLARRPAAKWTRDDLNLGRHFSHKYRKQLAERPALAALNLNVTPPPPPDDDPFARTMQDGASDPKPQEAQNGDGGERATEAVRPRPAASVPSDGLVLDDSQAAALALIRDSPVAILTGGPGTGKTTITRQVVAEHRDAGKRVVAAAPTGIAASRLAEAIGYPAVTLHRALGAIPDGEGIMVTSPEQRERTVQADLVVIDEVSMVTSRLFHEVLKVLKPDARLLLIGDADQLSPVGSGQPFTDIIESGKVPVARLTTVHRQAEGSRIREACDMIRRGEWYSAPPQADRSSDLVWLTEDSEERLADLCEEVMVQARGQYDAADITLITPRVTGGTAGNVTLRTEELNRRLQQRLNPAAAGTLGGILEGDPIVCTKNRPADDVWNGTAGVAEVSDGKLMMRVTEDRRRLVSCIEDCELAYALSVHKYQGSQNRLIIIAAHTSGGQTLTRRLLYTAVSRAQERVFLLGPGDAFRRAAQTAVKRRTLLAGLLDAPLVPDDEPKPSRASSRDSEESTTLAEDLLAAHRERPRMDEADRRALGMAGPGLRHRMLETMTAKPPRRRISTTSWRGSHESRRNRRPRGMPTD